MNAIRRLILVAGAVAIVAIALGTSGWLSTGAPGGSGATTREAPGGAVLPGSAHAPPAGMRTLLVSNRREPARSLPGTTMRALRISGAVPAAAVVGTVITDEDCAPDAAGTSHCVNKVRMASGGVLTVRHPHRMAEVPCMTPGERIRVRAA